MIKKHNLPEPEGKVTFGLIHFEKDKSGKKLVRKTWPKPFRDFLRGIGEKVVDETVDLGTPFQIANISISVEKDSNAKFTHYVHFAINLVFEDQPWKLQSKMTIHVLPKHRKKQNPLICDQNCNQFECWLATRVKKSWCHDPSLALSESVQCLQTDSNSLGTILLRHIGEVIKSTLSWHHTEIDEMINSLYQKN